MRKWTKDRILFIEQLEARCLLSGSISGSLWNDADANGVRGAGEAALAGWTVYLDQNRNRVRDTGEVSTATDSNGLYSFPGLNAGTYYVASQTPSGWEQTTPGYNGSTIAAPTRASLSTAGAANVVPLSYTGSDVPVYFNAIDDVEVRSLINFGTLRSDPRFNTADGRNYSVAVLDTGIDVDHSFFGPDANADGISDRIVYQYDFADGDGDASDWNGHGTNVASLAAGGDQGATYEGTAPGANIVALKVFKNTGEGNFGYIEQALQWIIANANTYKIASINMSLSDSANWSTSQSLYGINDEIAQLAQMNVLVVTSTGNSYYNFQSQGVGYPAADPNVVSVGAVYDSNVGSNVGWSGGSVDYVTNADKIMSFSQRSTTLTSIFAPGGYSYGAALGGGVSTYSGTSQAAPLIAGIAAMAQQMAVQQIGRRLTLSEFENLLTTTGVTITDSDPSGTQDNVANSNQSYKRVDALALANAIYAMGTAVPYEYTVTIGTDVNATGADFGNVAVLSSPDAPDLSASSDSGISSTDNATNFDNSSPAKALSIAMSNLVVGAQVTLYSDGNIIGSGIATAISQVFTTNGLTDLSDGTHTITAKQSLGAYAVSAASPPLVILVDTVGPSTPNTPTLQSASDSGFSSTDGITNVTTPTISFSVGSHYFRVFKNGVSSMSTPSTGNSYTLPTLTDGTYSLQVRSEDIAGNVSALSNALSVTIDTAAPSVPAAPTLDSTSDSGFSSSDGMTNDSTPSFKFTASPYYRFYVNGSTSTAAGSTGNALTLATLADGNYSFQVTAEDAAGNQSALSTALSVTIDTAAPSQPSAPALQATSDSGASSSDRVTNVTTPIFDLPAGTYQRVYRDGVLYTPSYFSGTTYTSPALANGTFNFTVSIVDYAGNESTQSAGTSVTVDTAAPTASITPVSTPRSTPVESLTIVFDNSVAGFDSADLTLTRDGGANLLNGSQSFTTSDNKTFTLSNLTALTTTVGVYVLTLTSGATAAITDAAGNPFGAGATTSFTVTTPSSNVTLGAIADAYVRDGSSQNTNYGSTANIDIKKDGTGNYREGYLTFDIGSLASVNSVVIRLNGKLSNTTTGGLNIALLAVPTTIWAESTLTYANRPAAGAQLAQVNISSTIAQYYDFDVTSYVQSEIAAGRTAVSFKVLALNTGTALLSFSSRNAASNQPQLVATGGAPAPQVDLVVTPGTLSVSENTFSNLQVKLSAAPTSDVVVSISRSGDSDLSAGASTLTFTSANWNTAQNVAISAAEDSDTINGSATFTFSATGITSQSATISEVDNDTAAPSNVTLNALAAATVRDGSNQNNNYGLSTILEVKKDGTSNYRESYLKFDLTSLSSTLSSAKLRLFGKLSDAVAGGINVSVYNVDDTAWGETTLTYANRPVSSTSISATANVPNTTKQWIEFDLTTLLQSLKSQGKTAATFAIKTLTTGALITFDSDEVAATQPQLVVTQNASVQQSIVVSTSSLTVNEGATNSFTVKLAAAPTSDVIVTIGKTGDSDLNASTSTLTFTAANWNVAQTVNVAAADDGDTTNGSATFTLSSAGLTSQTVTAAESDNDTATSPQSLNVLADATVRNGSNQNNNYGSATNLEVKQDGTGNYRESYLKFDISSITSFTSAKLRLYGKLSDPKTGGIDVSVYDAADTTWTESAITFASKPATGTTPLATANVPGTTFGWVEWDLSAYLQSQKSAGKTQITLVLKTVTPGALITFNSGNNAANKPALAIS